MDFMEEHFDDEEDHIMDDGEEDSKDAGDCKKGSRQSRKRTKTGCLTCRRRRIKCGEERPVCGNCIKSKRQCEGYNQRVVFKDPMNTWRGPGSNASPSIPKTSTASSAANRQRPVPANASFSDGIPDIKPTTFIGVPRADGSMSKAHIPSGLSSHTLNTTDHSRPEMPGRTRSLPQAMSVRKGSLGKQIDLSPTELQDSIERSYVQVGPELADPVSQPHPRTTYNMSALLGLGPGPEAAPYPLKMSGSRQSFDGGRPAGSFSQDRNYKSDIGDVASDILLQSFQNSANWPVYSNQMSANGRDPLALGHAITSRALMNSWNHNFRDERDQDLPKHQILQKTAEIDPMSVRRNSNGLHSPASQVFSVEAESSDKNTFVKSPVSKDDALEMEEDEIASDEYNDEPAADYYGQHQDDHLQQNDLGIIVAKQAMQEIHGYHVRTFNSIIESFGPGILTGYQPSVNSSPLNDPTSARIFIHFINVLGPSISQFERHPANPSLLLQGQPVPSSQHHLWTYTMPTLALKNKALLHAMLALSSFHIAKMQDGPLWPSLKHYQLAIRQVGKNVSLPTRRGHPETLAATLILGFYELMSAEHQKWSNHLLGAKHQLNEIDFRSSTRQIKALRRELGFIRNPRMQSDIGLGHSYDVYQAPIAAWEEEVDESLIKSIMGSSLQFDAFGAVIDGSEATGVYNETRVFSQAEIDIYECQRDLFWLFCKHDCFQSILGGNRLYMNYSRYSHCSPRAPVGRRDAIYGTYDHLVLLMARVADFAARDIKRKKLAVQLNGGRWKPPVGFGMADIPTPPLDERSVSPSSARPPAQSPPPPIPNFPGMFPNIKQNQKPARGFSPGEISHSSAESEGEMDFDAQTRAAELEWHEIRDAFRMLEDRFGPDFQPLGPEHSQPIETAFGPALQYRTYGITSIWVTFYFSLIVCHRAHPSMPPAAMMAAGICAAETDFFAQQIGRAAAGIAPNAETATEVTTQVGSALIETSLGLFIAGIQYQDPSQRRWLIQRCRDTARLTSWQTALPIARGCEVAWVKVAEMGRGPPYTKVPEEQVCAWKSEKRQMPHHQYDIFSPAEVKKAFTIQDRTHLALGLLSIDADLDIVDNV